MEKLRDFASSTKKKKLAKQFLLLSPFLLIALHEKKGKKLEYS